MQADLSRLTRALRKETCPRRVHDEVRRRILLEPSSHGRLRPAISVALAVLVLACGFSIWQWQAGENAQRHAELAARTTLQRARIANQAEAALGLIGAVLVNVGAHFEKVISARAVLPLQNSLEVTKNKIIENIKL
jgi:hypothetical protein